MWVVHHIFSFNPDNSILLRFKMEASPQTHCLNAWSPANGITFVGPLGDGASWKKVVTEGRPLRIIACSWLLWHLVLPGLLWCEQTLPHLPPPWPELLLHAFLTRMDWNFLTSGWFCQVFCCSDAKITNTFVPQMMLFSNWYPRREVLRSKEVIMYYLLDSRWQMTSSKELGPDLRLLLANFRLPGESLLSNLPGLMVCFPPSATLPSFPLAGKQVL